MPRRQKYVLRTFEKQIGNKNNDNTTGAIA